MGLAAKTIAILTSLTIGSFACSRSDRRPPADQPAPAQAQAEAGGAHAAAAARPGSHDDWCGEHQVPESQCTRCNPDLIAAFKATGDWCAEHGLPESQCTRCNPELKIVRPAKEGKTPCDRDAAGSSQSCS